MTILLLTLAGLALVDSTSFGTLGIPVFLLLTSRVPRLSIYLVTVVVFYFLVGVALMLGLSAALESFGAALETRTAYWVQVALGVGLFALSYRFDPKWRAKRGLPERRFEPRAGGPRAMVLLGLTAGMLEVATMLPYLAAIGIMTTSELTAAQWLPLLAAYVLVMILPILVLLGLRTVARSWVEPKLDRLRAWLARNSASMVSWTLAAAGVLLGMHALDQLF